MNDSEDSTKSGKYLNIASSSYGSVPDAVIPIIENDEVVKGKKTSYTSTQKYALLVLAFGNFCTGSCSSLQAPFFPSEAERKGATATEYGFIFGVYQLTIFFMAPLIGKLIGHISPKFILNSGIFILGSTCILFGTLGLISQTTPFVVLAFIVRCTEGIGASCVRVSSVTFVASMFGQEIGTTYAILEMCTGVGAIIGPVMGGALYELGGYPIPFLTMGSLTLLDAVVIHFVLPDVERKTKQTTKGGNIFKVFVQPGILVFSLSIFTSYSFNGFNQAGLEPHVRECNLSVVTVGLLFSILGLVYAISSPFWGWLNDNKCDSNTINLIGSFIFISGVLFIGPVPFIQIETNVYIIGVSMVAIGFSVGAKMVSCFTGALYYASKSGLPDDLGTYGKITSIITSCKSLGSFFGPSVGGVMLDKWGYRFVTMLYLFLELALVVYIATMIYQDKRNSKAPTSMQKESTVSPLRTRQISFISETYGSLSIDEKKGDIIPLTRSQM